jgi:hypothetical protein
MRTRVAAMLVASVVTLTAPITSAQVEYIDSYIALMRTDLLAEGGADRQ